MPIMLIVMVCKDNNKNNSFKCNNNIKTRKSFEAIKHP